MYCAHARHFLREINVVHALGTLFSSFRLDPEWPGGEAQALLGDVVALERAGSGSCPGFPQREAPSSGTKRPGDVVSAWGDDLFVRPHGIAVADDETIWCVDDRGHAVVQFDPCGTLMQRLPGEDQSAITGYKPGYPHTVQAVAPPFCYPTSLAVDRVTDHLLVSDGYGNAAVHEFGRSGRLERTFGMPGDEPGQFVLPHGVMVDASGRRWVSDRENDRVQIFDQNMSFLDSWPARSPNGVVESNDGKFVIAELGRVFEGPSGRKMLRPNAPRPRVTVRDTRGTVTDQWSVDSRSATDPALYLAPHGLAIDSMGRLYVGEVCHGFSDGMAPKERATLHRFLPTRSHLR